ncbi:MAG: SWIM zinc finger family protein [Phascolarctobacterium sp.]|uniref:SWIM zinc finger family protein n=1 Tax=Phascolarctobacterium sp. TaxID=2049039 RepID=UPI0026DC431F|nr:SWIM zinc finger family protein [Phascolarctobacterium sp.]MDO4920596.1 SWIM zinc finger family protein [Phascolarctobacterium sp.]
MKIKGWKKLFQERILERGWIYCLMDHVHDIKPTPLGYAAIVSGTEDYTVSIALRDGKAAYMECDCPYAEDGNNCKHMAAVLYKLTGEQGELSPQKRKEELTKERQQLNNIITQISEEELRAFLLGLALSNGDVKRDLLLKYANIAGGARMQELKGQIYAITGEYEDGRGFIDWEHAYDYTCALSNYLSDTVAKLLENKFCMQAFELTYEGLSYAYEQDMDDDGGLSVLGSTCADLWRQIARQCDDAQAKELFAAAKKALTSHDEDDFIREYLYAFLMDEFHSNDFLKEKLQLLDADIADALAEKDNYLLRYRVEKMLVKRIQFMKELQLPREEILRYQRKYRDFPEVRLMESYMYLQVGDVQAAVGLLNDGKKVAAKSPEIFAKYSRRLQKIFQTNNWRKDYLQELEQYIFTCRQDSLEYILSLKENLTVVQWPSYRAKILAAETCADIRYELLEKESMYEELLQAIVKEKSIWALDKYERVLRNNFPESVRDIYIKYIQHEAAVIAQRDAYKKLMRYLRKLRKYPDGDKAVQAIAADWRVVYRRRTAMLDELAKAGF